MILGITSLGAGEPLPFKTRAGMTGAHLAGGAAGGGGVVLLAWLLLAPLRTMLPVLFAATLVAGVAIASLLIDLRIWARDFSWGHQVPATWKNRWGPIRAYAAYGALLGGLTITYVPYMCAFVVLTGAALLLPVPLAVACGAAFGFSRAAAVTVGVFAGARAQLLMAPFVKRAGTVLSVLVSVALLTDVLARQVA